MELKFETIPKFLLIKSEKYKRTTLVLNTI